MSTGLDLAIQSIAACLLVRNSEGTMASCLARVQPFFDEIILGDLASTDRTVAIATDYGARVVQLAADEPPVTAHATCEHQVTADWLVWIESADALPENCHSQLQRAINEHSTLLPDALEVPIVGPSSRTTTRNLRLVRNSRSISDRAADRVRVGTPPSTDVDVVILSYAKTTREYAMTSECLRSLRSSSASVTFHVVVVETSRPEQLQQLATTTRWFGDDCNVVFPGREFNYNDFLQAGFHALQGSNSPVLLIANNDLLFEPGFAEELLSALEEYDSVSPWCPGYHERMFALDQRYHEGRRTSFELCGWAIMFHKRILERCAFADLFPKDFAFWFQDNYYAWQLECHALRHALVTPSKVHHLFQQSHDLIAPERRHELTEGAQTLFAAKVAPAHDGNDTALTIAIAALPNRVSDLLPSLVEKLTQQAAGRPVEILALLDNKWSTLGAKRNALVSMARGRYITFVDDDDDVSDDYVERLLHVIQSNADVDCISFNAWVTLDGGRGRVCKYGTTYDDVNETDAYYRRPNQVCCFRTDIVRRVPRADVTWSEDTDWARKVCALIEQETRLDETLYYYRYDSRLSEGRAVSRGSPSPTTPNRSHNAPTSSIGPLLTVAILSVPQRVRQFLGPLIQRLAEQSEDGPVELLVLLDNQRQSIGCKRNALLQLAHGRFLAFVDDDDDVTDDYVSSLLAAIGSDPMADCVVFDAWVTSDGHHGRICHYGVEYENRDEPEAHYRRPNHICCIRADIAKQVPFDDISWHEDFHWSDAIANFLRTQTRIGKTLYHYRYNSATSETTPPEFRTWPVDRGQGPDSIGKRDQTSRHVQLHTEDLPIYGFMHVAMMNHWRDVVEEQLLKLRASGLLERTKRLYVGLLGPRREDFEFTDEKLEVAYFSTDVGEAEPATLKLLQQFCRANDGLVYYIHTKGVFRASECTRDWRHLMEHFIVQRHEDCLRCLTDHDACGVNLNTESLPQHFSGNFWWARADYIRTLPPLEDLAPADSPGRPDRHACERWIGSNPAARIATLHHSHVNHYHTPYPRNQYARLRQVPMTWPFEARSAWRGLENRFQDLLEPVDPIQAVVEIGVEYGFSLLSLAAALPSAVIIGVDPYERLLPPGCAETRQHLVAAGHMGSEEAAAAVACLLKDSPNALLFRGTSADAAERLTKEVDVLHIDAIPTYDDVRGHFLLWEPKVRPGGCILFHDTISFPESVGRFFRELPGRKAEIRDCHGLGAWYKPKSRPGQK